MTIVILGGGIDKNGNLPQYVKKRLDKAIEIFKKNKNSNILVSGKYSFLYPKNLIPPITEAQAMRNYLIKKGILKKNIFLENKSKDTISNAYYSKKIYFIPKKEKKAKIITSEFHLPRVKYIFKKVFGKDYKFQYVPIHSNLNKKSVEKVQQRQKELLKKTKEILGGMKDGNHNFLKNKFYKLKYYREKRPDWVIDFVTQGK
jgi:uncharacterized SAM-binding protein YcdF (DUF218 family)